jgi:hypothetical protein
VGRVKGGIGGRVELLSLRDLFRRRHARILRVGEQLLDVGVDRQATALDDGQSLGGFGSVLPICQS